MISCYLRKLVGQVRSKPNEEWLHLKSVIESGGRSGLDAWLKEVALLASDLESNFESASRGKKSKYCLNKIQALEDRYRRQAAAYKKAIDVGPLNQVAGPQTTNGDRAWTPETMVLKRKLCGVQNKVLNLIGDNLNFAIDTEGLKVYEL